MALEDYVNESWECPECDEDGMNEKEWSEHGTREHPEEDPFSDMYPEYAVCRSEGEGAVHVYMKAETEIGPFYMAWDDRDHVERMPVWELYRHDWEPVLPEDTPFPKFEDGDV